MGSSANSISFREISYRKLGSNVPYSIPSISNESTESYSYYNSTNPFFTWCFFAFLAPKWSVSQTFIEQPKVIEVSDLIPITDMLMSVR